MIIDSPQPSSSPRRSASEALVRAGIVATVLVAFLSACGGGGGGLGSTVPPGGTASATYAFGPIRGFGSVIVNGVRFDDSAATISDDDGSRLTSADLHLGMVAEVEAGDNQGGRAKASSIVVHSAIVGPVAAVDPGTGSVSVLGQTVTTDAQTAFDDTLAGGLAALAPGDVIKVYGAFDAASQSYLATRIERDAGATQFKLRGTLASVDMTLKIAVIGGATIDFSGATGVPANLVVGDVVVARLALAQANGMWVATTLGFGQREVHDHGEAHLSGTIGDFVDSTHFSVDGTPVDATGARFPDGTDGIVAGATVEVEGAITGGVLIATSVSLESEHDGHGQDIELHGTISGLDTTAQTFLLRGSVVSYGGSVSYTGGTVATLANGIHVEVRGDLSADGTQVVATLIDFTSD